MARTAALRALIFRSGCSLLLTRECARIVVFGIKLQKEGFPKLDQLKSRLEYEQETCDLES